MIRLKDWLVAAALSGGFLLVLSGMARPHDLYEWACCSNLDCAPVADSAITTTDQGYRVNATMETVPYGDARIRKPIDENYHVCRNQSTGVLLCIYPKIMGF